MGEIRFPSETFHEKMHDLYDLFRAIRKFRLEGKDELGYRVILNNCYLISISESDSKCFSKFNSLEVIQNPERLEDSPKDEILVEFGLLNMDKTFRVTVDTHLGKLCLAHIKDHEEYLRTIKIHNISAVTAIAQIHIGKPALNTHSEIFFRIQLM
ncbi:hypothetical protein KEJ34_09360 [Candidatus Bathyarchaeota archaeon]|nr:hypothetical protein [Candidatus Bathyarchaeota archaeon]